MKQFPDVPLHETFSDEEFIELVNKADSISGFMRSLGYKSKSSYPKVVVKRCQKLGVEVKKCWDHRHKHTNQELAEAAKLANSVTDTMIRLGLKPNGYAHARFKERLRKLGFSWKAQAWNKGKSGPKRDLSEYLVIDGPKIGSSSLRIRLIREGLKKEECEECGISEWNGKKAPLQLDHIDGDRNDNRLEKLRILCANCHAQTETHSRIKN